MVSAWRSVASGAIFDCRSANTEIALSTAIKQCVFILSSALVKWPSPPPNQENRFHGLLYLFDFTIGARDLRGDTLDMISAELNSAGITYLVEKFLNIIINVWKFTETLANTYPRVTHTV